MAAIFSCFFSQCIRQTYKMENAFRLGLKSGGGKNTIDDAKLLRKLELLRTHLKPYSWQTITISKIFELQYQ